MFSAFYCSSYLSRSYNCSNRMSIAQRFTNSDNIWHCILPLKSPKSLTSSPHTTLYFVCYYDSSNFMNVAEKRVSYKFVFKLKLTIIESKPSQIKSYQATILQFNNLDSKSQRRKRCESLLHRQHDEKYLIWCCPHRERLTKTKRIHNIPFSTN